MISGGIGSGKSAVRKLLDDRDFFTVDADSVGHAVLEPGGPAFDEVAERWPEVVERGEIDRAALGNLVFADREQLRELEGMTHPHIFGIIRRRVEENQGPVAVEVPILEHRLGDRWKTVIVDCHDEIRLKRLVDRGMSDESARARMAAQPSRGEWLARADLVVPNHGSLGELASTLALLAS